MTAVERELAAKRDAYTKSLEHMEQYEWWRLDSLTDAAAEYIDALERQNAELAAAIRAHLAAPDEATAAALRGLVGLTGDEL